MIERIEIVGMCKKCLAEVSEEFCPVCGSLDIIHVKTIRIPLARYTDLIITEDRYDQIQEKKYERECNKDWKMYENLKN